MRIVIASPEAVPYVKTGGLADVAGSLIKAFRKMKKDAILVLPLFKKVRDGETRLADTGISLDIRVGDRIVRGGVSTVNREAYFIECDEYFDRPELYGTAEADYGDNAERFVFFSKSVPELCRKLGYKPDIIHCNDWQTALIPLYLRTLYKGDNFFNMTAALLTIHNLGYQGLFPASQMPLTNLGWEMFTPEGIEFYGMVNFLKAGVTAADVISTVSETYAKEILLPGSGFGLDGVLKKRAPDLYGIMNGIDYGEWNPAKDALLPANYSMRDLSGKLRCKNELLRLLFKKTQRGRKEKFPVAGMVTRLSEQKGIDIVVQAIPDLMSSGIRLVILGKGDEHFQKKCREISDTYKDRISLTVGFDETLAHMIYAGSDFFLMPSKYEPCGLGQLIALRYGTIPIARKTGGLADTIRDFEPLTGKGTGFLFSDYAASGLVDALKRAFCVFTDGEKMKMIIRNGMRMDFGWEKSARRYLELYEVALRKKRA